MKEGEKKKKFKDAKAYKYRLKKHKDAVISICSQDGINSTTLISGSSDHSCIFWDLKSLEKSLNTRKRVSVARP